MAVTYIDARGRRVDPNGKVVEDAPSTGEKSVDDMTVAELDAKAEEMNVEFEDGANKAAKVQALKAAGAE